MTDLDLDALHRDILDLYTREHASLGEYGALKILDFARQFNLSPVLNDGGVIVFPHAGVLDCGYQIAAAVNACLDCGADRVMAISVLHAFTDEMEDARIRVAAGEDPNQFACRGIQGPGLAGRRDWETDHVLMSFRYFWEVETKRRGIRSPELIERYPYLAGGKPWTLPGFDDLEKIGREAVIVSTADAFHHGIGYGDPPEKSFRPEEGGLELAQRTIEEGLAILGRGDYWGYNQHCVRAKSDARDAGQVFRYLCGPMTGRIIDLTISDAAELYGSPDPTWVACALTVWLPDD
jgi:hypothetical protein